LNVGVIQGGTTVNTIAAEAHMELDLRSEGAQTLEQLSMRVEELVLAACGAAVQVQAEVIGQRPAGKISAGHVLIHLAKRCLEAQGIQPNLNVGSTDANIPLSRDLPAVCVGLSTGGGAHTIQEFVHTEPIQAGLAQLVLLVESVFRELEPPSRG